MSQGLLIFMVRYSIYILMLSILRKKINKLKYFPFLFFFFLHMIGFDSSYKLSPTKETVCIKCQSLLYGEIRKISICRQLNLPRER